MSKSKRKLTVRIEIDNENWSCGRLSEFDRTMVDEMRMSDIQNGKIC
jgi:hypothetical protein